MRTFFTLLVPLAAVACNQPASGGSPDDAPSVPAAMATTNATIEPVPTAVVAEPAPNPVAQCGADKAARFVGRQATPAVRLEVAEAVGHLAIRWIGPEDAVTLDYSESRLNAELDASGRIERFRCG